MTGTSDVQRGSGVKIAVKQVGCMGQFGLWGSVFDA